LPHEAAAQASLAARINPFAPQYLIDAADADEASAAADGTPAMLQALHAYELLDGRFYRTAYGVMGEARMACGDRSGRPGGIPSHRRSARAGSTQFGGQRGDTRDRRRGEAARTLAELTATRDRHQVAIKPRRVKHKCS
jgi:hypothetical protein